MSNTGKFVCDINILIHQIKLGKQAKSSLIEHVIEKASEDMSCDVFHDLKRGLIFRDENNKYVDFIAMWYTTELKKILLD